MHKRISCSYWYDESFLPWWVFLFVCLFSEFCFIWWWRYFSQLKYIYWKLFQWDFPGGSDGKASAYNAGDPGSIPGLGRSPGEGNGNPLQYSCLENPMDGGTWEATVHGVPKSQDTTERLHFLSLFFSVLVLLEGLHHSESAFVGVT